MLCTYIVLIVKTKTNKKQFMYKTCSELVVFMYWTGKSMNNLFSYFVLVDVRIDYSDKYLPLLLSLIKVEPNGHRAEPLATFSAMCFSNFALNSSLLTGPRGRLSCNLTLFLQFLFLFAK